MIKLHKLEQLEELKQKYTKEVIESIEEVIVVINESYGADRDVDKDLGGYVAILESEEDVTDIKANVLKGLLQEYTDIIKSDYGIDYYSSLFLLSDDYSNDKLVKEIVTNINLTRKAMVDPSKDELEKVSKELDKIEAKKKKLFEAYEDDIITKGDFSERIRELKAREESLQQEVNNLKNNILGDNVQGVSYELVKEILLSFDKMLTGYTTREQQKKLLHMLISKITINKVREIESIELNINDNLIMYLNNG